MQGHVGALLTSRLDERRHGQGQDQTGNQGRDSEQPRGGARAGTDPVAVPGVAQGKA